MAAFTLYSFSIISLKFEAAYATQPEIVGTSSLALENVEVVKTKYPPVLTARKLTHSKQLSGESTLCRLKRLRRNSVSAQQTTVSVNLPLDSLVPEQSTPLHSSLRRDCDVKLRSWRASGSRK